ncbi:MAG: NADH:flavin oxidoreductase/NADH oxidase family protein [Spirochaetaceae bacterium]|nr:MAG: NADH:flavin oxidoreductase/NADH oxidase family protein [Spirochaetaceae bacterium]
MTDTGLSSSLTLPCGVVLKNRCAKSAMSDSLGDGRGNPTDGQVALYSRWAYGGAGLLIVGEVHGDPQYLEKPGNLVMRSDSDHRRFRELAAAGRENNAHLWLQLGHAGALAYPPCGRPVGPSALDLPELSCDAMTLPEIANLPGFFAETARLARELGFGGVQLHAAHGFLLSQFLSPRFNLRGDAYGGGVANRVRLLVEVIEQVRAAVGPDFPVAIKLNSSDGIEGGLGAEDALQMLRILDQTSVDLIEISGGSYFPGAQKQLAQRRSGPYFTEFTLDARNCTEKPLMVTGGFKTREQAELALESGAADIVGMARALVLNPELPQDWMEGKAVQPEFPVFSEAPEGGVTAWYTMKLAEYAGCGPRVDTILARQALELYDQRDQDRVRLWNERFL